MVLPPSTSVSIYMCNSIITTTISTRMYGLHSRILTMIIYLLRFDIPNSLQSEKDGRVINVLVCGAERSCQFKRGLLTLSKEAWSSSTMAGPSVAPILGVETSAW